MCGRFVQVPSLTVSQAPWPELADDLGSIEAHFNLAPTQRAAIVLSDGDTLEVRRFRWGLIPPWVKDLKGGYSTINARLETVDTKPAFRGAFKAPRRCLVPMLGYYEWVDTRDGKQPYFIQRADGEQLYAAGLWEPRHRLQAEDEAGSCTIITHDAVDEAGQVHARMPVFLDPGLAKEWMTAVPDAAMGMLMASPVPQLKIAAVDRRINNSRYPGGPDSILPLDGQ